MLVPVEHMPVLCYSPALVSVTAHSALRRLGHYTRTASKAPDDPAGILLFHRVVNGGISFAKTTSPKPASHLLPRLTFGSKGKRSRAGLVHLKRKVC